MCIRDSARDAQLGIDIHHKRIPVDRQVKGACEILGLDPLYVANEGVFMAVVSGEIADDFVKQLRTFDNCNHAAIIGEVVETHPRQVILTSAIGGKRVVNMLVGEQLPRIC